MSRDNLKTYGEKLNAQEIMEFLEYALKRNDKLSRKGKRGTPICIWGTHGIGKTQAVITYAQKNEYTYVYCAPAQFEEMGDLHGIPETFDPTPEAPNSGDEYTVYRPPEWLKAAIENADLDKPGLLILDDFNRAEHRILQGCMQLLQMHALFSWSLPPRWQIILTANPEGGPYSVTEMDDAMLTRMLHVTMKFDPKSWAIWARDEGIDPRGIDFILTYPEVVTGIRTTARSLTQFLQQVEDLKDLSKAENIRLVRILGKGTMEDETVDKFLHFCKFVQKTLLQPEEILEATDFDNNVSARLKRIISGDGYKRNDLLNTICTRLLLHVTNPEYKFKPEHKINMVAFLLNSEMEQSLRFKLHHAIVNAKNAKECKPLVRDATLAKEIIRKM
jgi:MoxR-like ATPase